MKWLLVIVSLVASACMAQTLPISVTAPGGRSTYYIVQRGAGQAILEKTADERTKTILLSKYSDDPKGNLTDFSKMALSTNGHYLYIQTSAWATSDAIHRIDLKTLKVSYVTDGSLGCVVHSGRFANNIIAVQHAYYVQGGSYEALMMYSENGRQIGPVGTSDDLASVCPVSSLQ